MVAPGASLVSKKSTMIVVPLTPKGKCESEGESEVKYRITANLQTFNVGIGEEIRVDKGTPAIFGTEGQFMVLYI